MHSNTESSKQSYGRSRIDVATDDRPTIRPTSRYRASDDDESETGGLYYAADVWRIVIAKRAKRRKP